MPQLVKKFSTFNRIQSVILGALLKVLFALIMQNKKYNSEKIIFLCPPERSYVPQNVRVLSEGLYFLQNVCMF